MVPYICAPEFVKLHCDVTEPLSKFHCIKSLLLLWIKMFCLTVCCMPFLFLNKKWCIIPAFWIFLCNIQYSKWPDTNNTKSDLWPEIKMTKILITSILTIICISALIIDIVGQLDSCDVSQLFGWCKWMTEAILEKTPN